MWWWSYVCRFIACFRTEDWNLRVLRECCELYIRMKSWLSSVVNDDHDHDDVAVYIARWIWKWELFGRVLCLIEFSLVLRMHLYKYIGFIQRHLELLIKFLIFKEKMIALSNTNRPNRHLVLTFLVINLKFFKCLRCLIIQNFFPNNKATFYKLKKNSFYLKNCFNHFKNYKNYFIWWICVYVYGVVELEVHYIMS